ncbi:hypothetical protein R6Q57_006673 [Mikania cordata]
MEETLQQFQHLKIQLEDIKSATNNFDDEKNRIGVGGFGKVYKGEVSHSKGRSMVAIKRLNPDPRHGQGKTEFLKEMMVLSRYRHENLVSLVGFCYEEKEVILVYEHASRGSLDRHLSSPHLTWARRLRICLDAAKGLCYLHDPRGTHQRLIHRDMKSANILLDDQWNAKVADFGLSIMGPANEQDSVVVANAAGTGGYWDPKYVRTQTLTKESDVYSFGVVLFEVLCGKLCCTYRNGRFEKNFVPTWIESYRQKKLNDIIFKHPTIQPLDQTAFKAFSDIAYRCLKESRKDRPKMAEVVTQLETALEIQELVESQAFMEWKARLFYYEELTKSSEPPLNYINIVELWKLMSKGVLLNGGKTQVEHKDENQTISDSDAYWEEELPADYEDIMKWSIDSDSVQWTTKKEAYSIIRNGFLIDDGKKWFSIDKNGKKCHMLSATDVCIDESIYATPCPESRFGEAIGCHSGGFIIRSKIESQLVSSQTTYASYLVYKLPKNQSGFEAPLFVNDEDWGTYIYLASPRTPVIRPNDERNTYNPLDKQMKGFPLQRSDGWMEVQIWEFRTAATTTEMTHLRLALITRDINSLRGLIIQGIEIRPI